MVKYINVLYSLRYSSNKERNARACTEYKNVKIRYCYISQKLRVIKTLENFNSMNVNIENIVQNTLLDLYTPIHTVNNDLFFG